VREYNETKKVYLGTLSDSAAVKNDAFYKVIFGAGVRLGGTGVPASLGDAACPAIVIPMAACTLDVTSTAGEFCYMLSHVILLNIR
jgi:hypothetical protein